MPVTKIRSDWDSGNLIFFEEAVGRSTTGDVLTIGTTEVAVGNTGQDVDFKVYLGASDQYVLFDCGNVKVTFAKVDVEINGDLTLDLEDLKLGDGQSLEFGDADGGDIAITFTDGTALAVVATGSAENLTIGDDTYAINVTLKGTFTVGKSDTGHDVIFYGATASNYLHWDESEDDFIVVGTAARVLHGADAAGNDVIFYGAVASYKTWWDANGDTNGTWYFGADTKGIMTYWYGDTTAYSVHFDPSGDTNGAWYFGADTKGIQVNLYGDITGCGVFWDPSTDTNGTLTIGASGGSKGNDLIAYGATNGNYLHWDQSGDDLLLVGTATQLAIAGTTDSTSNTTGSLRTAGGLGVAGRTNLGKVVKSLFIGGDSDSAGSGIPLVGASWDTSQGIGFYADDGGSAQTGYTETFTSRYLLTADIASGDVSVAASHPDLTINANYTGTGGLSAIWGNTTIKSAKSVDTSGGLGDVSGGTFGVDIVGTLAANSHAAGVSVGVGGSGTKTGILCGYRIRGATGTVDWDGILSIEDGDGSWTSMTKAAASATATMANSPKAGDPAYWLKIYIAETAYYFPVWTD